MWTWNDFLWPLLMINSTEKMMLTVGTNLMTTSVPGVNSHQSGGNHHHQMPANLGRRQLGRKMQGGNIGMDQQLRTQVAENAGFVRKMLGGEVKGEGGWPLSERWLQ